MNTLELQQGHVTPLTPVVHAPASLGFQDFESVMRFAIEKGVTLESIVAVRRELKAEHAREMFDAALRDFQAACPVIEKRKAVANKGGNGIRYKYAPLDDIVSQVKALLQTSGFSYSLTAEVDKTFVKAICTVKHAAGHSETSAFQVPIDPQAFMNEQQKFASALTFAKRYAFCNAFGILTGDEDTDGALEKEKPQGPSTLRAEGGTDALRRELWDVLKPVRGAEANWKAAKQWLVDECVLNPDEAGDDVFAPQLAPDRFREVINKAKGKVK